MRVTVLGSGSRGNAIALETAGRTLLVDAGFGARTLIRRVAAAGVALNTVEGIVLTHEHNDHSRGAARLASRLRSPIYGSRGTLRALTGRLGGAATSPLPPHQTTRIGPFAVTACRTSHDAVEPLALAIEASDTRQKVGVAYDLGRSTAALRNLLQGCQCLIVEANHDDDMLHTGPYPAAVRQRIAGAAGHLSNRDAAELLAALCHEGLSTVVLVHLSHHCNRPRLASEAVRTALAVRGFRGTVLVATQDRSLTPFGIPQPDGQCTLDLLD